MDCHTVCLAYLELIKIPLVRTIAKHVPKENTNISPAMLHVSNVIQGSTQKTKVRPIVCHAYQEDIKTTTAPLFANNAAKDNTNIFTAVFHASNATRVSSWINKMRSIVWIVIQDCIKMHLGTSRAKLVP